MYEDVVPLLGCLQEEVAGHHIGEQEISTNLQ